MKILKFLVWDILCWGHCPKQVFLTQNIEIFLVGFLEKFAFTSYIACIYCVSDNIFLTSIFRYYILNSQQYIFCSVIILNKKYNFIKNLLVMVDGDSKYRKLLYGCTNTLHIWIRDGKWKARQSLGFSYKLFWSF